MSGIHATLWSCEGGTRIVVIDEMIRVLHSCESKKRKDPLLVHDGLKDAYSWILVSLNVEHMME